MRNICSKLKRIINYFIFKFYSFISRNGFYNEKDRLIYAVSYLSLILVLILGIILSKTLDTTNIPLIISIFIVLFIMIMIFQIRFSRTAEFQAYNKEFTGNKITLYETLYAFLLGSLIACLLILFI